MTRRDATGLTFRVTDDIPRYVVATTPQMLVGIAGYFHTAGRRMKSPWLPTGIGQAKTGFLQEAGREVVVVRREEPLLARNGVDEIGDEPLRNRWALTIR